MAITHVEGKKAGDIIIYTLSTCIWCKKTKQFLNELGVSYKYIDVDLLSGEEKNKVSKEIQKWNPSISFPTIVINNKDCILGYQPDRIKETLDI